MTHAAEVFTDVVRHGKQLSRSILPGHAELGPATLAVLIGVARLEPCRLNDVAEHHLLDASTTSRQVDQLVRLGLVDRAADPGDRRAVRLSVTATGRQMVEVVIQRRTELWNEVLGAFDDDELAQFVGLHQRLLARLEDADQSARQPV